MDMRKKEDRLEIRLEITRLDNEHIIDSDDYLKSVLLQLLDMADENEKLKEQIAFYKREQSNAHSNP